MKEQNQKNLNLTTIYEQNRLTWGPVKKIDTDGMADDDFDEHFKDQQAAILHKVLKDNVVPGLDPSRIDEHTLSDVIFVYLNNFF